MTPEILTEVDREGPGTRDATACVPDPATDIDLLRTIVEAVGAAILVVDDGRRCVLANPAAGDLLGRDPGALRAMRLDDLVLPEARSTIEADWARLAADGRGAWMMSIVRPDGSVRHVEARARADIRPGRHLLQVRATSATAPDEAAVHRATEVEVPLVEGEGRSRTTLDEVLEGAMIIGPDWRYLYVNETAAMHGHVRREDVLGRRMPDVYPGIETTDVFAAYRHVMEDRVGQRFEERFTFADGTIGWYSFSVEPVPEGILVLSTDVSAAHAAQEALRVSEERFRATIETLLDPLVVLRAIRDADGTIVDFVYDYANRAACLYNRTTPEALIGMRLLDLLPAHESAGLLASYAAVVETGEPLVLDGFGYEDAWGGERTSRVFDVRANRMGESIVYVWRDVTDQRALAETMARAARAESVGRLAGGVAHDFNNVLAAIDGYAELLAESIPVDDPRHADVEAILEAGKRAAALTHQLLAFGRRQTLEESVVEVDEVVAGLVPMLRSLVPAGIDLVAEHARPVGRVRVDRTHLEHAIVNLVVNARDAMPAGGTITITTDRVAIDALDPSLRSPARAGEYVRVTVADTGTGIDREMLPHVFEPFFTTKAMGRGAGLGLSSVEGAVAQSGGFVSVTSEVGRGSSFAIHLPRTSDEPDGVAPLASPSRPAAARGSETILLAEDEPAVRAVTARTLRDLGYAVIEAADPAAALAAVDAEPDVFDILVTDMVMPGMSGRDLADQLSARRPDLPVLYISGYAPGSATGGAPTEPGAPILAKPFGREDLAARVRALLDGQAQGD